MRRKRVVLRIHEQDLTYAVGDTLRVTLRTEYKNADGTVIATMTSDSDVVVKDIT